MTSCDPLQLPGVDRSTVTVDHDATNAALLGHRSVRYLIICYLFLVIWPSIIAMLNTFFSCSQSVQYLILLSLGSQSVHYLSLVTCV